MGGVRLARVDGAAFTDCLFLIGQAWVHRAAGDVAGAGEDLAAAVKLVPEGSVEFLLGLIEAGEWPEPGPGLAEMDAWLERCRLAGTGELKLFSGPLPAAPRRPGMFDALNLAIMSIGPAREGPPELDQPVEGRPFDMTFDGRLSAGRK